MTIAASVPTEAKSPSSDRQIAATVARLRRAYDSGVTRSLTWRLDQLDNLERMMKDNEAALIDALRSDLGKPYFEAWSAETNYVLGDIKYAKKNLSKWVKPRKVKAPLVTQPAKARIYTEPLGVVLIIAPWNYPLQLALAPLTGAIAAGNCALVKPSEVAPATSAILAKLIPRYLDTDCIAVVEGAVPETTELLNEQFDHIFYTGNGSVGRIVMQAAAKHLTPVTLELGGKSPCIVDGDVDLEVTARRITWGKFANAGQTCIAPDYVLVHESLEQDLLRAIKENIRRFYGDNPKLSQHYGRIVNERHHRRLMKLLPGSGEVYAGGEGDERERYIAPTVLTKVSADSPIMADEIFGPILPVLRVASVDAAIDFVNQRPKPLALYVFSKDKDNTRRVIERTSSGGACVNDVVSHFIPHELPFGGVGESGIGAYHGKASFDTFSHRKSVLDKPTILDPSLRYPPYSEDKVKLAKRLL